MSRPIDYSKWDHLASDSEEELGGKGVEAERKKILDSIREEHRRKVEREGGVEKLRQKILSEKVDKNKSQRMTASRTIDSDTKKSEPTEVRKAPEIVRKKFSDRVRPGSDSFVEEEEEGGEAEGLEEEVEGYVEKEEMKEEAEGERKNEVSEAGLSVEEALHRSFRPSGEVGVSENVAAQMNDEKQLEALFFTLKNTRKPDDPDTLAVFFQLFDVWIGLYRLRKCDEELRWIVPECRKRNDDFKTKGIQALAFTRWKQSRFREAVSLFHEMEEMVGKSAALCENIGHTYSSLGDYDQAEAYFLSSLELLNGEVQGGKVKEMESNKGGVLLGLGLILHRREKHSEALPRLLEAYYFYKKKFEKSDSSLIAKAGSSVAKCYESLGNLEKAEEHLRECLQLFEVTSGEDSPLTGTTCKNLGEILWKQRKREEARFFLDRALYLEGVKDAVDIRSLMEIHELIVKTHVEEVEAIDREQFKMHRKSVLAACESIREKLEQDGNCAVFFKLAAEMFLWMGDYKKSVELCEEAIPLFKSEKSMDCSKLVAQCEQMKQFAKENLEGERSTEMLLEQGKK